MVAWELAQNKKSCKEEGNIKLFNKGTVKSVEECGSACKDDYSNTMFVYQKICSSDSCRCYCVNNPKKEYKGECQYYSNNNYQVYRYRDAEQGI